MIFDRNVCPAKQLPVVCNKGVWLGSSLRVILNSLPLTNQKAGEIMSELMDGSVVVPVATCWSCHQNPSSRMQFLLSLFENRAISVQPICSPMSQYTF